jgi:hypothetical protein
MSSVFICYRREDTRGDARDLYKTLTAGLGEERVFKDIDKSSPGRNYVKEIQKWIDQSSAILVVIGSRWLTAEQHGKRRLEQRDDPVRREISAALQRKSGITVIPVLVGDTPMPSKTELPAEIQGLADIDAAILTERHWDQDVQALLSVVRDAVGDAPGRENPPRGRLVLEGVVVGGMAAFVARWMGDLLFPEATDTAGRIVGVILRRTETWAVAGAALAIWLTLRAGGDDLFRRGDDLFRRGMGGLLVGAIGGALCGAIFALPVYLADPNLGGEVADWIGVGSFAVSGGFLGGLIGALWRPPRLGVGLASGVVAGAVMEVILDGIAPTIDSDFEQALAFGVRAAAVVGLAVAVLLALDAQASTAKAEALPRSG